MEYSKVRSGFIKKKIRGSKWRRRDYIDDLVFIEKFIVDGVHGWAGGMMYHNLKSEYPREWKAIYRELKPKELQGLLAREKKEELRQQKWMEEFAEEERREEALAKKEWKKMGGLA